MVTKILGSFTSYEEFNIVKKADTLSIYVYMVTELNGKTICHCSIIYIYRIYIYKYINIHTKRKIQFILFNYFQDWIS